jgi:hypothetical protein
MNEPTTASEAASADVASAGTGSAMRTRALQLVGPLVFG